jgi:hypothetical protein
MIQMFSKDRGHSMASFGPPRARALAFVWLAAFSAWANATVTVLIDGAAYPAELRENTRLLTRLQVERSPSARHYEGELIGVDQSWIRASDIRGHWQGVVSIAGHRYVVDGARRDSAGDIVLDAVSPNDLLGASQCATEVAAGSTAQTLAQQLSSGVEAADFAALCTSKVDGVCLLPELDITFDLLFQQRYPATFQQQGVALLNIVDGYYKNDMSLQFDALSMTFPTTDIFSATTDPNALLTDVATKKNNNQISFVTNKRALLHLVTGRNLDGSTVGISNVGTLCSAGSNVGLSQVVTNAGLPDTGLTALVIAHELGHNFGAGHDGSDNTCPASGFIMSATLSPTATHFSSCSVDEMTTTINNLALVNACFEFPVDASIVAHPGNPTTANANEPFTLDYDVAEVHASVPSATIDLNGSFTGAGGTFVSATLNGNPCAVAGNGATYACATDATGGLLSVTAQVAAATTVTAVATAAVAATGGVKDIDSTNNTVNQSVTTSSPPAPPTNLTATPAAAEIDLAWQDNSANETGFRIERRVGGAAFTQIAQVAANVTVYADTGVVVGTTYDYRVSSFGSGGTSAPATASAQISTPANAGGGGGGGGGGALGAEVTPLLLALFALRRRTAAVR